MRRKRLFALLGASILLCGLVYLVLQRGLGRQAAPISIQFTTKIGSWNGDGPYRPGAKFLLTNHTPKTVVVKLCTIEVRTGSVWTVHSALSIPEFTLAPHAGLYANIEPQALPGGPWRLKGWTVDNLAGFDRTRAGLGVLARVWARGRSFPGNPFSTNITYYGHHHEVLSQEAPNH